MNMNPKNNTLKSLDTFIEQQYGKEGTPNRDKFEKVLKLSDLAPSFSKPDSKKVSHRNNSQNDAVPTKAIFPKSKTISRISAFPPC
jgi:hypothetical protein